MKNTLPILIVCFLMACSEPQETFDWQGHRGARGLMPENSIPGFIHAVDLGVNTLEMDLAITADGKIVVSHEPYFSSDICQDPDGNAISEKAALEHNIYEMNYREVKQYDCGSKPHPRFPEQKKISTIKPLLSEVIDTVETYTKNNGISPLNYNIEIKSSAATDNLYHPVPSEFADRVYALIDEKLSWDRVTIQSFDFRVLQYIHKQYRAVPLVLLIENQLPWRSNIDSLEFVPAVYSCDYKLLSADVVSELQNEGMKVIPWTVNDRADMDRLIEWGADGIITDYPNRIR